jgi:hypothetical protein
MVLKKKIFSWRNINPLYMDQLKIPQVVVGVLLYNEKNEVYLASHKKRGYKYVCV